MRVFDMLNIELQTFDINDDWVESAVSRRMEYLGPERVKTEWSRFTECMYQTGDEMQETTYDDCVKQLDIPYPEQTDELSTVAELAIKCQLFRIAMGDVESVLLFPHAGNRLAKLDNDTCVKDVKRFDQCLSKFNTVKCLEPLFVHAEHQKEVIESIETEIKHGFVKKILSKINSHIQEIIDFV